jgi:hypothetical protein
VRVWAFAYGGGAMRRTLLVLGLALGTLLLALSQVSVAAAGIVDLQMGDWVTYSAIGDGTVYLDGYVANLAPPDNNCTDVAITATARNDAGTALGSITFPLATHVLSAGHSDDFHQQVVPPSGTSYWTFTFSGASTDELYHGTTPSWTTTTDGLGRRYYTAYVTGGSLAVSSLLPVGSEWQNSVSDEYTGRLLDTQADYSYATSSLSPWQWVTLQLVGRSAGLPGYGFRWHYAGVSWVAYTPRPVWRFYNRTNNAHFYTDDAAEKARIESELTATYQFDGVAYQINTSNPSNMRPLFRFFNLRNGTHFYTADESERDRIRATLASTYSYDGPAYSVSTFPYFSKPVFRFYNRSNGSHLYTADVEEWSRIDHDMRDEYNYEGVGYYLAY